MEGESLFFNFSVLFGLWCIVHPNEKICRTTMDNLCNVGIIFAQLNYVVSSVPARDISRLRRIPSITYVGSIPAVVRQIRELKQCNELGVFS